MSEPRFLLDEDSVCYGCGHFVSEEEIGVPVQEENLTCGGICDCNIPCVNGSMNDYDSLLNDRTIIDFIQKVGTAAKTIKRGESTEVPCDCGGTLTVEKSSYNGHIHAGCNKCDKCLME